ncbi:hypothetical protein WJ92_27945 [Burkholderia ubonensis]|uniref:hypothetical protein n=1 Tax=Burkholderia ubonensis TaxID=101571 RepID=UPI00075D9EBE|nr:hypothetical protein [Burkholderia ubonensis]KVO88522.1 hypothetical protein WJ80_07705 [Burkholderia ubonensis]KVP71067.1 hypothetical protein WJ92_27945 [Burkholderia ubonensis]
MTIEKRLQNWARAYCYGEGHSDGTVASIYFPNSAGMTVASDVDVADAELVERAWRRLMPLDKQLLRMHYMWHARPAMICRRLGLKVNPRSVFDFALSHARKAIEEQLSESVRQHVRIADVIARMQIDVANSK